MARLYLLCFLLQRYQRINDNLINALIYQVRKVLSAAKVCLQERLLSDRMEGSKNVQHIGQILDLFLDDSIADSVSFGEIKRRAFSILERDKIRRAADFIGAHSIDVTALEWEFVANLAPNSRRTCGRCCGTCRSPVSARTPICWRRSIS